MRKRSMHLREKSGLKILFTLVLTAFLFSCAYKSPTESTNRKPDSAQPEEAEVKVDAGSRRRMAVKGPSVGSGNCPFGKPVLTRKGSKTKMIKREVFTLLHDNLKKVPLWVCHKITKKQLGGSVKRKGLRFRPDPELTKEHSAGLKDYRKSGYDRGHLAPAGDYTQCRERKGMTFFLSNMVPQKPGLNRFVWARLEAKARSWAERIGEVYIITGPVFKGESNTIGPGKVAVPSHFYKIVVAKNKGKWKAAGYVLKNEKYPCPYAWKSFVRTIDRIEEKTGLNFMPQLTEELEKKLEG